MAKKHTDTETTAKSLKDIFESVDALNADASLLSEENSLSIVSDWIDTGSYALNAIFSGSVYRGVPTLFLSDLHWGENVRPSQINGVNQYNLSIAHERLQSCIDSAIDLLKIISPKMDYLGLS